MRKESSSPVRIFYPKFDRERVTPVLPERLKELSNTLPVVLPRLEPHLYREEKYQRLKDGLAKMTEGGVVLFRPREESYE